MFARDLDPDPDFCTSCDSCYLRKVPLQWNFYKVIWVDIVKLTIKTILFVNNESTEHALYFV